MNPRASEYPNSGLLKTGSALLDLCTYYRHDSASGFILFPNAPAWLLDQAEAEAGQAVEDSQGYLRTMNAGLLAAVRNASMRAAR